MSEAPYDNESERRRKVADEKMWGAIIETIERVRVQPKARSIAFRLLGLYQSIVEFQKTVVEIGKSIDYRSVAPSFTTEQTNFLIKTYNSVIEDLCSHFEKKDSYVSGFSTFKEIDEPSINDVAKTLFMMGTNISQIIFYMMRWMSTS